MISRAESLVVLRERFTLGVLRRNDIRISKDISYGEEEKGTTAENFQQMRSGQARTTDVKLDYSLRQYVSVLYKVPSSADTQQNAKLHFPLLKVSSTMWKHGASLMCIASCILEKGRGKSELIMRPLPDTVLLARDALIIRTGTGKRGPGRPLTSHLCVGTPYADICARAQGEDTTRDLTAAQQAARAIHTAPHCSGRLRRH